MKPFWRWIFWTCWGNLFGSVFGLNLFCFFLSFMNALIPLHCGSLSWGGTSRSFCHFPVLLPGCCLPSFSGKQEGGADHAQHYFLALFCFRYFPGYCVSPTLISQSLKSLCVSSSASFLRYGNSWEAWETWKHETCILLIEWIIIMIWTSRIARAGSISQGWKSFWKEHCHGCPRRTQSLISIHIGWQWKLEKFY